MTDSLLTSSKEVAATQNRFNTDNRKEKKDCINRESGKELSEKRRAKGSALGLPLFLCSPEISPSLSHHFSDFTVPAIAI